MIKILEGENTFLSKKRLDCLIEETIKKDSDISCKIINADTSSISDIINEYETMDMFSKKKLLIIKRLLSNKEYKDFVEEIADKDDTNHNVELIIWEEKKIPKNTRYYKLFEKLNLIESFNKFNKRTFQKWAEDTLEQENIKTDKYILQNFIEMVNYDPNLFLNEINKFKLANKEDIKMNDLENNVNNIYNNTIWEFIDSINKRKNRKETTKILLNLLKNGLDPHYLMVMIARNIKQILLINRMIEEEKSDREIVTSLKIPPFTLPKLKSIAKQSDYNDLLRIYEKIYNLNYETKVGTIEPTLGLILLIARLN